MGSTTDSSPGTASPQEAVNFVWLQEFGTVCPEDLGSGNRTPEDFDMVSESQALVMGKRLTGKYPGPLLGSSGLNMSFR